ncbi:replication initiation protein [Paenalcaligenes hominis]|jgi:hypothetical protein|uniref:replication initiation protein n=1 Tax=Paenalcaligenes hominis TaxID=643674 RepID=UPI00352468E5
MTIKIRDKQLNDYIENLPKKPYCSNDLGYGLLIRSKKKALEYSHIQHNKHTDITYLVLDVDHSFSLLMLEEQLLPTPNFLIINPKNFHAHIFYELKTAVHKTNVARQKPLRYLASIEYALKKSWKADEAYTNFISKNPINENWTYKKIRSKPWELGELADWLTLPSRLPRRAGQVGLGRNCTLFDMLRFWAYDNVLEFRINSNRNSWSDTVLSTAESFNSFPEPLPVGEIKATAKSVANWTWDNYTKRLTDEEFSARQAHRGRAGGLKGGRGRTTQDLEKRAKAREMRAEGMTYKVISEALNIPHSTIGRWCK